MKKKKFNSSSMAAFLVLIVLVIVMSIVSSSFLSANNLMNVMQQITVNAVIAVGMTIVILTSGIDLSVGSVMAISGFIMGKLMMAGLNGILAVILGTVIGVLFVLLNGVLVAKCKLQPMIATLGTMQIARGITLTIAQGRTISGFPQEFRWFGNGTLLGIPIQVILMLILYILLFYLLRYRKFGRYIYSIGGNEEATRLSGVNVTKYKIGAYVISGATAAAVITVGKLNSAVPTAGEGYELDAIASTVIGGTSLLGGFGSVWGTLMGAMIIGIIKNGLNLMNVSAYVQKVVIGIILLIAVLVDSFRSEALNKKK